MWGSARETPGSSKSFTRATAAALDPMPHPPTSRPSCPGPQGTPGPLAELGFQGCHLVYQAVVLLFGRLRIGLFRLPPRKSCCHKERLGVKVGERKRREEKGSLTFGGKFINHVPIIVAKPQLMLRG